MASALRLAALRPVFRARGPSLRTIDNLPRRSFTTYHARLAASSVSGQPASKDMTGMKENAKEEVKKVTSAVADAISGGNDPQSVSQVSGAGSIEELESSVSSLTGLAGNVPKQAWITGAAGFLPYIGTSLSTIYLARQAGLAEKAGANSTIDLDTALALLHHVETIQVSYGAVILSFLGAIHWGFEFSKFGGKQGMPRYLMGVAPVLLGWPTILLPGQMALAAQWAAFTGVWFMDSRATARGWTPKWYSTYRFGLTAVVGSCILLTLGATSYFQTGHTSAAQKLARIKTSPTVKAGTESAASPKIEGEVGGDISTESGDDAYVVFDNEKKRKEEEEKKRKEEEEAKQKEEEEKAKKAKEEATTKARDARDKAEGKA